MRRISYSKFSEEDLGIEMEDLVARAFGLSAGQRVSRSLHAVFRNEPAHAGGFAASH